MPNKKALKKRYFKERVKRLIKLGYLRILRIDDSTEKIARGAALGAFIGLMPTLGIGIILCLIGSFLLKVNKAASIIASFVMNPFTAPLVWSGSVTIGKFIFWREASDVFYGEGHESLIKEIGHIPLEFVTGNTIIASIGATIVYIVVKKGVVRHRARKATRKLRKKREKRDAGALTALTKEYPVETKDSESGDRSP
jgi:uncharacterized protein (TIGR03546 family)